MRILLRFFLLSVVLNFSAAYASDHSDTPFLTQAGGRHDARLTDLYAFTRGNNLVIAIGLNPTIPSSLTSYKFASDLKIRIGIDNHSVVNANDPLMLGGTIQIPNEISADHEIKITFNASGGAKVHAKRVSVGNFFAGLRDDPFIRAPVIGKNVAAIVFEVPLADVTANQSTILVWSSVFIKEEGMVDLGGRALRSMFFENLCLTRLHRINTSKAAAWPPT